MLLISTNWLINKNKKCENVFLYPLIDITFNAIDTFMSYFSNRELKIFLGHWCSNLHNLQLETLLCLKIVPQVYTCKQLVKSHLQIYIHLFILYNTEQITLHVHLYFQHSCSWSALHQCFHIVPRIPHFSIRITGRVYDESISWFIFYSKTGKAGKNKCNPTSYLIHYCSTLVIIVVRYIAKGASTLKLPSLHKIIYNRRGR